MAPDDDSAQRRSVLPHTIGPHSLRVRDARRAVVSWVRSAPGTHAWLAVIAVNSVVLVLVPSYLREFLLHHNSTNLVELQTHPVRVLIVSALWIQSPSAFAFYALLYEVVHAPAERWLGTGRWLVVAATAHIGATLVSQRAVQVGIRLGALPDSLAHTVDIGVSYGLAGVAGVLVHRVPGPRRWRLAAAAVLLGLLAFPLLTDHTFTDLGHFCAVLIGLAFRPVTPAYRGAGLPLSRRKAAPGSPRSRRPRWRR